MSTIMIIGKGKNYLMVGARNVVPDYFEHVSLTTGHSRRSYHSEVEQDVFFKLLKLSKEALAPKGVEVCDDILFQATQERDMYIGTFYAHYDTADVPFLITGGARTLESGKELWHILHSTEFNDGLKNQTTEKQMPGVPFVADRILGSVSPGAMEFMFSGASGDFCRCMGWAFLYPELTFA